MKETASVRGWSCEYFSQLSEKTCGDRVRNFIRRGTQVYALCSFHEKIIKNVSVDAIIQIELPEFLVRRVMDS